MPSTGRAPPEQSRGSYRTGRRNPTCFESGKPYLDGFRIVFMSGAVMVTALRGGLIMAKFRGLTPAERDRFKVEVSPMEVAHQKATYIAGNHEVGLDSNCVDVDDPNQMLRLYVSSSRSPTNFSLYEDATLDDLFECQRRTGDAAERKRLIREFENRYLSRSMTAPLLWWHRIVVYDRRIQGWQALPSHYLNQDPAGMWLAN